MIISRMIHSWETEREPRVCENAKRPHDVLRNRQLCGCSAGTGWERGEEAREEGVIEKEWR